MPSKEELKIAIVSGASHALKYLREHPRATDDEAIQHVTREADHILSKVGQED